MLPCRAPHRTHRFAILAMSLSSLFDISQPSDFLRAALNMLTEHEQAKEENDRPKMVALSFLFASNTVFDLRLCTVSASGNGQASGIRA